MEYLNSNDVAEILGVNVSTVKRWTDEGKLTCDKTAGGHRKFQLHHIAHFLEMHDSHRNQLNSLLLDRDLDPEIGMEIISGEFNRLRDFLLERAFNCDHQKVTQLLNVLYIQHHELHAIFDKLIAPSLRRIGELWQDGKISVTEEHFASQTIYDALLRLQAVMDVAEPVQTRAFLLNMATELHVIPLKMVQLLLEHRGYTVLTSGQITPSDTMDYIIERMKPDRIYVSSTFVTDKDDLQDELDTICESARNHGVKVFVGGAGFDELEIRYPEMTTRLDTFEEVARV